MLLQNIFLNTKMSTLYGIGELIRSVKINSYYEKKYKVQVSNYRVSAKSGHIRILFKSGSPEFCNAKKIMEVILKIYFLNIIIK